mgnify:CR=1 FL=1
MSKIIKILRISPLIAFRKIFQKSTNHLLTPIITYLNKRKATYLSAPEWFKSIHYHTIPLPPIEIINHFSEQIKVGAALVSENKFDLLGSGIKTVRLEQKKHNNIKEEFQPEIIELIESFPNKENRKTALSLLDQIDKEHKFIDWQSDFKSNYHWDISSVSSKIKYGNVKGADIKVPWELGRMQYLITLSYAYYLFTHFGNKERATHYESVFKNIILDFRISNPPKFGVQWISPMDAAIRAVNIIVAYSFFKQAGAKFDDNFEKTLLDTLFEHIEFVRKNPEWNSGLRGNHYLACISSLLIISTYLPTNNYSQKLFVNSFNKLIKEIFYQFYDDGGNFEGSMPYHRFCSEMVFYSLFSALSISKSRFELFHKLRSKYIKLIDEQIVISDKLLSQLFRIFEFLLFNTTKSHYVPQFGDNDGGYFIHLTPLYVKYLPKKVNTMDFLFHSANNPWNIMSFFAGFFYDSISSKMYERYNEYYVGKILRNKSNIVYHINSIDDIIVSINKYTENKNSNELYKGKLFEKSGICSVWDNKYHLVFSVGKLGQKGKGGHNHSDCLSFELFVDNMPIIVNAGTYCYTPFPKIRNRYRSICSHNTILYNGFEQNIFSEKSKDDLFWIEKHLAKGKIIKFSDKSIIAEHYAFRYPCRRIITFEDEIIEFNDYCKQEGNKKILLHLFPGVEIVNKEEYVICDYRYIRIKIYGEALNFSTQHYQYSLNYGLLQNAECLIISSENENVNWKIKIY